MSPSKSPTTARSRGLITSRSDRNATGEVQIQALGLCIGESISLLPQAKQILAQALYKNNLNMTSSKQKASGTTEDGWTRFSTCLTSNIDPKVEQPATRSIEAMLKYTNARLPFSRATSILDNGCGNGAILSEIFRNYAQDINEDCNLICADFSGGMIEQVKKRQADADDKLWPRVQTLVADATNLVEIQAASQSHVLAGWVYFMTPDPFKCLSESRRVLKDGGLLCATSWHDSQWIDILGEMTTVNPQRVMPVFPSQWTTAQGVKQEFEKAGFKDVVSENVTVYMDYKSHEGLIDFLTQMPHVLAVMDGASQHEVVECRQAMLTRFRQINAAQPGRLSGVSILTVGSKSA